jgi:hypothetical protein
MAFEVRDDESQRSVGRQPFAIRLKDAVEPNRSSFVNVTLRVPESDLNCVEDKPVSASRSPDVTASLQVMFDRSPKALTDFALA